MEVPSLIIMTGYLCTMLLFVSSCVYSSSATTVINLAIGDRIKIIFDMSNMGQATSYTMFEYQNYINNYVKVEDKKITSNSMKAVYTNSYLISNVSIIVYLHAHSYKCKNKTVAILRLADHHTGGEYLTSCVPPKGCNITIDWGNDCYEKPSDSISKADKNQPTERNETIMVLQNRQNLNHEYTLSEGENVTFFCDTDHTNFCMKWIQKKDREIIMEVMGNTDLKSSINIVVSRFDDGTAFQCLIHQIYVPGTINIKPINKSGLINIKVEYDKSKTFYEMTNTTSKEIVPYYDHSKLICSSIYGKKWIKLWKDGVIKKNLDKEVVKVENDLTLLLNLNETHNNTDYVCISVTPYTNYGGDGQIHQYNKREILKLVHLRLDADHKPDSSTDLTDPVDSPVVSIKNNVPMFAGAGGVVIVLMLVVLIYMCNRKPKPQNPAPHEVETYACPSTVQYLDLQVMSPNTRRCLNRDNTPYAEVIGYLEPANRRR